MFKFKNQKSIFIILYRTPQRINRIFEILGLDCFAFAASAIDKTFTQRNFLPSKVEIVSMYFPIKIKEQMMPKIRENLKYSKFQSKIYWFELND